MPKIARIIPRKIYDSNSNPTIEVEVCLDGGASAVSAAPKSLYNTKEHIRHYTTNLYGKNVLGETIGEVYDNGVDKTIQSLEEEVIPEIVSLNLNVNNHEGVDSKLATLRKEHKDRFNLIVNSSLAISNAIAKAAAKVNQMSLVKYIRELFSRDKYFEMPIPLINIFDGGIYTNNNLVFQSLMIVPVGANSFKESIRIGAEIFHIAKKVLHENGLSSSVGDHGGYASIFCLKDDSNVVNWESIIKEALDIILKSINTAGYKPGTDVLLAIDVAADSSFYDEWVKYGLTDSNDQQLEITQKEIISFYCKTAEKYPIILIEDALADNDEMGWIELSSKIGENTKIAGGDIFFNQDHDRERMVRADVANSVVISLDRIATLSEVFDIINFAKKHRLKSVIYNGLGDTEDVVIADLSVACNIELIKVGGFCRTERIAKYNQLLRIEEELGKSSNFNPHKLEG